MKGAPSDIFGSTVYRQLLLLEIPNQKPIYNQHPIPWIDYPSSIGCFRSLFFWGVSTYLGSQQEIGFKNIQLLHLHCFLRKIFFEIRMGFV